MKLKNYTPKYKDIELLPKQDDNMWNTIINLEALRYEKAVEKYGECKVLSVRDYKDTKTTSIIVDARGVKKCSSVQKN